MHESGEWESPMLQQQAEMPPVVASSPKRRRGHFTSVLATLLFLGQLSIYV